MSRFARQEESYSTILEWDSLVFKSRIAVAFLAIIKPLNKGSSNSTADRLDDSDTRSSQPMIVEFQYLHAFLIERGHLYRALSGLSGGLLYWHSNDNMCEGSPERA